MIGVVINPGTEGRPDATLENAEKIVDRICVDLDVPRASISRKPSIDRAGGFFGFEVDVEGKPPFELEVPGDDPEQFCLGRPFASRRMYVDGSSWLYGFALGIIESRLI